MMCMFCQDPTAFQLRLRMVVTDNASAEICIPVQSNFIRYHRLSRILFRSTIVSIMFLLVFMNSCKVYKQRS